MIEILYTTTILLTIIMPCWTGFVLIGVPIIYLIGITVASVFLFRWFRKNLREQENQNLEKIFTTSYTFWILFIVLLPVTFVFWWFLLPSSSFIFAIPAIVLVSFLIFLFLFISRLKKIEQTSEEESDEN